MIFTLFFLHDFLLVLEGFFLATRMPLTSQTAAITISPPHLDRSNNSSGLTLIKATIKYETTATDFPNNIFRKSPDFFPFPFSPFWLVTRSLANFLLFLFLLIMEAPTEGERSHRGAVWGEGRRKKMNINFNFRDVGKEKAQVGFFSCKIRNSQVALHDSRKVKQIPFFFKNM